MNFLNIVSNLQEEEKNKKRIVITRCGAFFVAIGKDAVILHEIFSLKTTCISLGVCKVGIPTNSLPKYLDKLEEKKYSFVIYNYSKDNKIIEEIYSFKGKEYKNTNSCYNCEKCEYFKKDNNNLNIFELLKNRKMRNED